MLLGNKIEQQTRRWNDTTNKTEYMRSKTNALQYYYFTEANISPILLPESFKQEALANVGKLPDDIKNDLAKLNINMKLINQLLDDYQLYRIFSKVYEKTNNVELTVTWVVVELLSYLKNNNLTCDTVTDKQIDLIVEMIRLLHSQDLNGKQAKIVFPIMLNKQISPEQVMEENNLIQIKDPKILKEMLSAIVDKNLNMLDQYQTRSERVLKFYLGMLMKETQGQANPVIANRVLLEVIEAKLKK